MLGDTTLCSKSNCAHKTLQILYFVDSALNFFSLKKYASFRSTENWYVYICVVGNSYADFFCRQVFLAQHHILVGSIEYEEIMKVISFYQFEYPLLQV